MICRVLNIHHAVKAYYICSLFDEARHLVKTIQRRWTRRDATSEGLKWASNPIFAFAFDDAKWSLDHTLFSELMSRHAYRTILLNI